MLHQECISLTYAYVVLGLSLLVVFNQKFFARVLALVVLLSIPFFYVEFKAPYMIPLDKVEDVITLVGVVGGLHLIVGQSSLRGGISKELVGEVVPKQ